MRTTRLILSLLAAVIVIAVTPAAALAQQPPPDEEDGWSVLGDFVGIWLSNMLIGARKGLAAVFWFLDKVACGITRRLMEESLWSTVLEGLVDGLRDVMPSVLRDLFFGQNGAGGLIYLALMMAGVLMIVPMLGEVRMVRPERVVLWSAVALTLFVSSTFGYDLLGLLEQIRVGAVGIVLDAVSPEQGLDVLVTAPMRATEEEVTDFSFALPAAFDEAFFPEPEYETVEAHFFQGNLLHFTVAFERETDESLAERKARSATGVGIAFLSLAPAYVVLLFGIVFATVGAGALVLIVFFLAAVPLGLFEFGVPILTGIVRQYAYLFTITLLAAVLSGLLAGVGTQVFEGGIADPAGMVAFAPILLIVVIAMQFVVEMAWSAMRGNFNALSGIRGF